MSDDVDYQELVQENIADIKERVQDGDLDPEAVLEAEQENKNRVTLVEWLQEQIAEDTKEDIEDEVASGDSDWSDEDADESGTPPYTGDGSGGLLARIKRLITGKSFVAGLLVGVVLVGGAAAAGLGGGSTGAVSTAQAQSQLSTYLSDNAEALGGTEITVDDVSRVEDADLYEASLSVTFEVANQTQTQNTTAMLTTNGQYLFLSQPIDTSVPLAQQLGQQAAPQ